MAQVYLNGVPPEAVEELRKILARLEGTGVEGTGDVAVEAGNGRWEFTLQDGKYAIAVVQRP